MGGAIDGPSVSEKARPGCQAAIRSHLNPLALYDPRSACGRGTFFWGIVYPVIVALLIYSGVMTAVFALAIALDREPSALIDRASFGQSVSVGLTWTRLALSALMMIRRAKDLGWSRLIAPAWLAVAMGSLLPVGPVLEWVTGAAQVTILILLAILPGRIALARRGAPG